MSLHLPAGGRATDVVAYDAPGDVTYADLWGLASSLRAAFSALAPESRILVLCEDRYFFAAALLAAWQAGRSVTLPPSRGSAAVLTLARTALVVHDGSPPEGAVRLLDVRAVSSAPVTTPPEAVESERVVVTLYTSGSRGEPIAWEKRARQLLGEAELQARELELSPASRVLSTVPAPHIYGLLFGVLAPLAAGASFARQTPLHGPTIAERISAGAATHLVSVPAHFEVLALALEQSETSMAPVRAVSSGAALAPSLARRLARRGLVVTDVLGSTETGGFARRRPAESERYVALPGVSLVVDEEERLVVRSPFLVDPEEPYVSGDRASFGPDGTFEYLGRGDDVVKVGGKRVSLAEVERITEALPGVRAACALKNEAGGLRGQEVWLVAVAPGYSPELLRTALRKELDPVLVPRRVRVVDALPRDERGKLRRTELRQLFEGPAERGTVSLESFEKESDTEARAVYVVPVSSKRFDGHFLGDPLLPALVQLHDLVLPATRMAWPELGAFTRMTRVKFTSPVRPGARVAVALSRREERVEFTLEVGASAGGSPEESASRGILQFAAQGPAREEHT